MRPTFEHEFQLTQEIGRLKSENARLRLQLAEVNTRNIHTRATDKELDALLAEGIKAANAELEEAKHNQRVLAHELEAAKAEIERLKNPA